MPSYSSIARDVSVDKSSTFDNPHQTTVSESNLPVAKPEDAVALTAPELAPFKFPPALLVPTILGIVALVLIVMALAFAWGTAHTIQQLTNPYIQSSALVKGFFAKLSQGHVAAQREKYIEEHLSLGGLTFSKKTGWLMFGRPAKISGILTNNGDKIVDTVTLAIFFIDGAGRIEEGGEIVLPLLIRPNERQGFSLNEKETGFPLPASLESRKPVYRIADCHFYEPPKP